MDIVIRKNIPQYLDRLRAWLDETRDVKLENMADFFAARLDVYEEHMSVWSEAYRILSEDIPFDSKTLLDLGCGTGLELSSILRKNPKIAVTGIDLSADMLAELTRKHPKVHTICADYFVYPFENDQYDCIVTFESLHHFSDVQKSGLFRRIRSALAAGGTFIEVDYLACCEEEERMLASEAVRRRARDGIKDDAFVHFDTPLTAEHELRLMREAGLDAVLTRSIEGASFIVAVPM